MFKICMRDWKTTRFTKVIRLTPEHSNYVNKTRGKKSRAGRLEEILKKHIKKYARTSPIIKNEDIS